MNVTDRFVIEALLHTGC